jgi:putative N6-adenine-specific DNA methylase
LRGSDRDDGAVAAAQGNARRAGVDSDVLFERRALTDAILPDGGWVVTNPPFGVRVSEGKDLRDLYASFGRRVSSPGLTTAWLCSDPEWRKAAGGEWKAAHNFPNGGLDLTILLR